MAYTGNHVLIAWGGTSPGSEIWTNTLRMRDVNPIGFADQTAVDGWLQAGFKDALTTFWTAIKPYIGTGTTVAWMKANRVGTDGKYLDGTTNLYTYPTPLPGTDTANAINQASVVVTTTTGLARGRAHAGRFFLPSMRPFIDGTTGTFSAADSTIFANASAAFLSGLNDEANFVIDQLRCCVMSNLGSGTDHDITGVKVGRVVDTQRRRRNKIVELGSTAVVNF